MHFTHEAAPDGSVMSLYGSFTFRDHGSFRVLLDLLKASPGRRHVLDVSGIEFLDSAAIGMLLIAEEEARSGGWALVLRKPSSLVARLFELAALDTLFTIEA